MQSRRLGWSLGIDLVPAKTCNFNCPFCQVGTTPQPTLARRAYVPLREVLDELEDWCARGERADVITLAGSGEPTLHSGCGEVLSAVRAWRQHRALLLSNGALLYRPPVRRDACRADVVKASLSAWDQASFARINR